MHLGLTEGDAHAQHRAFAIGPDADGDEHGAIEHAPAVADLFIAGVDDEVGAGFQRAGAPAFQLGVQAGGALADLGGTDGGPAELLDDGGDFAGGDALHVHLGQGQFECLLAAHAFFERAGIEGHVTAHLGNLKLDRTQAGGERFGFEAIGVTQAKVGAFSSWPVLMMTHDRVPLHRSASKRTFMRRLVALFGQELQDGVQEFRLFLVGHVIWFVGCVC